MPFYLSAYNFLSRMVHPSSYHEFRNLESDSYIDKVIGNLIVELLNSYGSISAENEYDFFGEEKLIYCFNLDLEDNYNKILLDIVNKQEACLKRIGMFFNDNGGCKTYLNNFFVEVMLVLHDINTDMQLGYAENVKLKFKVIAEMFACFDKVYFQNNRECGEYLYNLLVRNDIFKDRKMAKLCNTEDCISDLYALYKAYYNNSKVSKEIFIKKFDEQLGFLISVDGKVPTLSQLVKDYFSKISQSTYVENTSIFYKDFYWLLYVESQNMSHGSGYLFFTNSGAWAEDTNIVFFLDNQVLVILNKLDKLFSLYSVIDDINTKHADMIKNELAIMKTLLKEKQQILSVKRVPKF